MKKLEEILMNFLYKKFKKKLFEKMQYEINAYLGVEEFFHPIRCTHIDEKIAVFHDDYCGSGKRDRIKFYCNLPKEE